MGTGVWIFVRHLLPAVIAGPCIVDMVMGTGVWIEFVRLLCHPAAVITGPCVVDMLVQAGLCHYCVYFDFFNLFDFFDLFTTW